MDKAGVDIALVERRPILEAIVANGEVVYDQTHTANLASRVGGTVRLVDKQVGMRVRKGDVLALVDAVEVGRAKAEFLRAIAQLRLKRTNAERLKPLAKEGTIAGRQLREAETALEETQIRLLGAQQALANLGLAVRIDDFAELSSEEIAQRVQFLGLPEELTESFASELTTSNLFPLRSPLDGVIIGCNVVSGEVVDTASTIFGVADVRRMWLTLDVQQDEAKYLLLGQTVLFRPSDSIGEPEIKGTLAWISTEADRQTRTVKVRVDLPNADGRLRANTFGTGRIVLREEPRATVVPSEAIHWDGCCHVVFVRDKHFLADAAPKFFHVRKVRVGVEDGDVTEIIAGLVPGEVIASKISVVLEAQLLKGNLGAGCCEVDSPKK
jgi:cobalt-zinc-cadmium efflux system membrane fusion protein